MFFFDLLNMNKNVLYFEKNKLIYVFLLLRSMAVLTYLLSGSIDSYLLLKYIGTLKSKKSTDNNTYS